VVVAVVVPAHPTMKPDLPQRLATDDGGFIGVADKTYNCWIRTAIKGISLLLLSRDSWLSLKFRP
jgi:hypothetical protein